MERDFLQWDVMTGNTAPPLDVIPGPPEPVNPAEESAEPAAPPTVGLPADPRSFDTVGSGQSDIIWANGSAPPPSSKAEPRRSVASTNSASASTTTTHGDAQGNNLKRMQRRMQQRVTNLLRGQSGGNSPVSVAQRARTSLPQEDIRRARIVKLGNIGGPSAEHLLIATSTPASSEYLGDMEEVRESNATAAGARVSRWGGHLPLAPPFRTQLSGDSLDFVGSAHVPPPPTLPPASEAYAADRGLRRVESLLAGGGPLDAEAQAQGFPAPPREAPCVARQNSGERSSTSSRFQRGRTSTEASLLANAMAIAHAHGTSTESVRTFSLKHRRRHRFRAAFEHREDFRSSGPVNLAVYPKPYAWKRSTIRIMEGDARQIELKHVLRQPRSSILRQLFRRHLRAEYNDDSLDFWEAAQSLRNAATRRAADFGVAATLPRRGAAWIWERFIRHSAPQAMNLSAAMRNEVDVYFDSGAATSAAAAAPAESDPSRALLHLSEALPVDLFDEAQDEIAHIMSASFERFKATPAFRRFFDARNSTFSHLDIGDVDRIPIFKERGGRGPPMHLESAGDILRPSAVSLLEAFDAAPSAGAPSATAPVGAPLSRALSTRRVGGGEDETHRRSISDGGVLRPSIAVRRVDSGLKFLLMDDDGGVPGGDVLDYHCPFRNIGRQLAELDELPMRLSSVDQTPAAVAMRSLLLRSPTAALLEQPFGGDARGARPRANSDGKRARPGFSVSSMLSPARAWAAERSGRRTKGEARWSRGLRDIGSRISGRFMLAGGGQEATEEGIARPSGAEERDESFDRSEASSTRSHEEMKKQHLQNLVELSRPTLPLQSRHQRK